MVEGGCLEPDDLLAWVSGTLSDAARAAGLAHIAACAACRQAISALVGLESVGDGSDAAAATGTGAGQAAARRAAGPSLEIGARLGRFRITRVLGRGGMGIVVAARDEVLDRTVAIKVVRPELAASAALEARLVREARTLAALRHPNLVAVLDVGAVDGWPFLVMELVEGTNLRQWMKTGPRARDAIARCAEAGRGLAALHAAGFLHRDVKPDNVIVAGDGRVVLVDLGLAKRIPADATAADASLTRPGALVGTPRYLAPELVAGQDASVRTDLYAFCAMTLEVARAGGADRLPARLRGALARGVDPDPAARFAAMTEVLAVLDRAGPRRARVAVIAGAAAVAIGVIGWRLAARDDAARVPAAAPVTAAAVAAPDAAAAPPAIATATAIPDARPAAVPDPVRARPGRDAAPAPPTADEAARAMAKTFERTLSVEYLRDELHRKPATAAFAEAQVLDRYTTICKGPADIPWNMDWGRVERGGIADITLADGKTTKFLLYQVKGQARRYLFDAYTSSVYLDVPVGALVMLCPGPPDSRGPAAPAGWEGDFVFMNAFGGPIAGAPEVLSRTPRPQYLKGGPVMRDGAWPYGDDPVLFVLDDKARSVATDGRREMDIYFLDTTPDQATALDRVDGDHKVWVVAAYTGLQDRRGTSYPVLRVSDVLTGLFTTP